MEKAVCYYHDDMDGYASAAIIKKLYPDVEFVKVQYGDDIKDVLKYHTIIIVDFTFPKKTMELLFNMQEKSEIGCLVWIDHHISAKQSMPKLWKSKDIDGLRKVNQGSAAKLTWEWFYPHRDIPEAIDYISRYDTWGFGDNETEIKAFSAGLNHHVGENTPEEYNSDWLNSLLYCKETTLFEPVLKDGYLLLESFGHQANKSIKDGKETTFHGYKTLIVNSNHNVSLIGEKIYNNNYDIAIIWSVRGDRVIFSLRSRNVDVAKIAEKYGGGGHKGAAGFWLPIKDFENTTGFEFLNTLMKEGR